MFDIAPQSEIRFNPTDPSKLCDERLGQIFNIEQDMWGREEWLWEYLKCDSCFKVYSKQDIYGHLPKNEYQDTVSELEEREERDIFSCQCCESPLLHSFWKDEYMNEIKTRYANKATLLLMERGNELIGFMDGYVASFDTIYNRELSDHYWDLGIEIVRQMVVDSLGDVMPKEFFSCSSSWTRQKYMNMIHIYNLLQNFYENFPEDMETVTALSELHAWWPYTRIFWSLWAKSIGIREKHGSGIETTNAYDSDIYVHNRYGETCKKAFSGVSRRDFLTSIS